MAQPMSDGFIAALKSSNQRSITKVEILDSESLAVLKTLTNVDDGSVTVDVSRGTRRTFQLRISNKDGMFTPKTWESDLSFGRTVRIYRGLQFYDPTVNKLVDEYALLGTFLIDRPEVFVERNMSVITLDGSDLWKKIASGGFPSGYSFAANTHVNTIIAKVAEISGITVERMSLDPLDSLTDNERLTNSIVAWEEGDNRSDFLQNIVTQFGLYVYFTPSGILTSEKAKQPSDQTPVWHFSPGEDSVMLGVTKTQSDLKLVNHIIVTGESAYSTYARYEIQDTDPDSPTYVNGPMGNRVLLFRAPQVYNTTQAANVALKLWLENALVEENIKVPSLCLPHLEGNDVVEVTEPISGVADKYLAQRFEIPLRDFRMTIESKKGRVIPT